MKVKRFFSVLLFIGLLCGSVWSAFCAESTIPSKPVPARLVNDYVPVLSSDQQFALEQELLAFSDSTSNQITVVIVPDLGAYDPAQYAYELGEQWGVGNKKYNNGVVLLIKPKNENGKGQVFIAPGYGLEGAIPDAACHRIINEQMIPLLSQNDYHGAILKAVETLKALASGEISHKEIKEGKSPWIGIGVVILFLVVAFILFGSKNKDDGFNGKNGQKGGVDPLLAFWLLSSASRSHSGSWGGFSGGGGGGGFGGFGGGSFGGGGAGGSW